MSRKRRLQRLVSSSVESGPPEEVMINQGKVSSKQERKLKLEALKQKRIGKTRKKQKDHKIEREDESISSSSSSSSSKSDFSEVNSYVDESNSDFINDFDEESGEDLIDAFAPIHRHLSTTISADTPKPPKLEHLKRKKVKQIVSDDDDDVGGVGDGGDLQEELHAELDDLHDFSSGSGIDQDMDDIDDEDSNLVDGEDEEEDDWKEMIPVHFSHVSTQPMEITFRIYIQVLASESIHPGFIKSCRLDTSQRYFTDAIDKVKTTLEDRKNTVVASNAWTPEFKVDLDELDSFCVVDGIFGLDESCHICRRRNRHASSKIILSGKPYDKLSMKVKKNAMKRTSEWAAGRFCLERSQMYHDLQHFTYKLFQDVSAELERLKSMDETKEEGALVNAFLDMNGFIETSFQQFKILLDQTQVYTLG